MSSTELSLSVAQMSRYNELISTAKQLISSKEVLSALKSYKQAYKIHPSAKLEARIQKLQTYVEGLENIEPSSSNQMTDSDPVKRPCPSTPDRPAVFKRHSPDGSNPKPPSNTDEDSNGYLTSVTEQVSRMSVSDLITEANAHIKNNNVEAALKLYEEAEKIQPTDQIQRRIDRLKLFMNKTESNSSAQSPAVKPEVLKEGSLNNNVFNSPYFKREIKQSEVKPESPACSKPVVVKPESPACSNPVVVKEEGAVGPALTEDDIATYNSLISSGKEMLRQGNFAEALDLYENAYLLNQSAKLKSRIDKIKSQISSALPEIETNGVTEEQYNLLLFKAKSLIDKEQLQEALDIYNEAYDIKPNEKLERKITRLKAYITENRKQSDARETTAEPEKTATPPNLDGDKQNEIEELTDKYNNFIIQAKHYIKESDVKRALENYQSAYDIYPSDKLMSKVNKCKSYLSEDESASDSNMVHVGNGFHLYKLLYDQLYPHQRESLLWFWGLHKNKKGGILADDMGLGKTIQVISFLCGLFDADECKTVLIIMPLSLIENWKREFEKWAAGINVYVYHGATPRERAKITARVQRRGGVLLTSYGMVVTCADLLAKKDGESLAREFKWDYVILDEGHKIKNPTKTSKGVHLISAKHRIILTGTPIQNNLKEMWALFDWTHHGMLLGTQKTFKMEYDKPITRSREKCATYGERKLGEHMAESLKKIISPYFLRRTKAEVKSAARQREVSGVTDIVRAGPEMPNLTRKNDFVVWVYLSELQQKIYRSFSEQDEIKQLLNTSKSPLTALVVLKKICDHPRLLSNNACEKLGLFTPQEMRQLGDSEKKECAANQIRSVDDKILVQESGKLTFLVELMKNLKQEGHRTLIFSMSRKVLDIIQKVLSNNGHSIMRMDGTITDLTEREKCVENFQNSDIYDTFLLTTQVGGVGLTLTGADRVVIFDPSWNPATDSQAVDRAFRIGQQKNVVIYRFISCGTVEEKIYRRQIFKDSVTRQTMAAQGDQKNLYRYFSKTELHELFSLDNANISQTQQQLESMHASHRVTDTKLDEHIAFLYSCQMFGLSDHDLMFSQEDEELGMGEVENDNYINDRVNKAVLLLNRESQLQSEINHEQGKYLPEFINKTNKPRVRDPALDLYPLGDQPGPSSSVYPQYIDPTSDLPPQPSTDSQLSTVVISPQDYYNSPRYHVDSPRIGRGGSSEEFFNPEIAERRVDKSDDVIYDGVVDDGAVMLEESFNQVNLNRGRESATPTKHTSNNTDQTIEVGSDSDTDVASFTEENHSHQSIEDSSVVEPGSPQIQAMENSPERQADLHHVSIDADQSTDLQSVNNSAELQTHDISSEHNTTSNTPESVDIELTDDPINTSSTATGKVSTSPNQYASLSVNANPSITESQNLHSSFMTARNSERGSAELYKTARSASRSSEDQDSTANEEMDVLGTSHRDEEEILLSDDEEMSYEESDPEVEESILADESGESVNNSKLSESLIGDDFGQVPQQYLATEENEVSFRAPAHRRRSTFLQPAVVIPESDDEDM